MLLTGFLFSFFVTFSFCLRAVKLVFILSLNQLTAPTLTVNCTVTIPGFSHVHDFLAPSTVYTGVKFDIAILSCPTLHRNSDFNTVSHQVRLLMSNYALHLL